MQALEELITGAKAEVEVQRQLQICNACRYCEGFCAVFPAMTRRLEFPFSDIHYLANLCHGCGACLHACQYAPPHQFAVNLPRAMARVRARTYAEFAWPPQLARLYERNGLVLALALLAGLALFLVAAVLLQGAGAGLGVGPSAGGSAGVSVGGSAGVSDGMRALWGAVADGSFYAIFPHGLMVGLFAPVFLFAVGTLSIGVMRFWRGVAGGEPHAAAIAEAARDTLRLKYLDGGHGEGCPNEDDRFTLARRRFHHFTMHGFLLCFAATVVATLYHYGLGQPAPYAWTSAPKVLGTLGGAGLVIGTVGLWRLRRRRDPDLMEPTQKSMDEGFIALLFLTGASGLALALARTTPAMPLLLCLHLASVLAFFATMPYGKFAHGVYRGAALLKWAVERRLPSRLRLGSE